MTATNLNDEREGRLEPSECTVIDVVDESDVDVLLPVAVEGPVAFPQDIYLQAIHARTNIVQYSVFALICALAGSVYYLNDKIESMQNAFAWRAAESKDAILKKIDRNYENPKPVTLSGENVNEIVSAIKKDQMNARARAYALQAVTCVNGEIGKSNSRVYSISYQYFSTGKYTVGGTVLNGAHVAGTLSRTRGIDTDESTLTMAQDLAPGVIRTF
jgi:hypothetical protein